MKKFFKVVGILIILAVIGLYLSFLFVLPKAVDLNKFKPDLQKIVEEQTNLLLDFENPQVTVTPLLSAGIQGENLKIKLKDNSEIVSADSFKGRISLPHLLFLTVKVTTAQIDNPLINIDIENGKAFKAVKAYEEILNNKEEKIEETLQSEQKPIIDPSQIKIYVPKVLINNYAVKINDLKTGNFLKLRGDELQLGYRNGKSAYIKTNAELYVNETKNINANINIDTFLPPPIVLDEEDDKAQRVEIPFVNPVAMYMAYDLKTNIDAKIKIRKRNNKIVSRGYFNVDNFTLNLSNMKLPESKLHLISRGTKLNIDSDLFITEAEKISVSGMLNYKQKPAMDLKIQSNKIMLNDVMNLIKATMDSLHIKHELTPLKGEGYFLIDTNIKTNFKKLISNGKITINNCIIKNSKNNLKLAKVNSVISLDNNILKFIDTSVEIAETLFKIDGTIDEKSIADISIVMEKLPLNKVFTMFMPSEINETYNVNSGAINLKANIKGELKKAIANMLITANNISLTDKVNKINYINNLLSAEFNSNFKTYTGKINNSDFKMTLNGANLKCDKFTMEIGEKDINITPFNITINNNSKIDILGQIENYIKNPKFAFNANGKLATKDLKQFFGPDLAMYIKEKGVIPVNVSFEGNKNKQTLKAAIEANKDNYITPVDIKNVLDLNTVLQAVIDFKGDRLKIKDTGFFIKTVTKDPENPEKEIITLKDVVNIDGTITKLNTQSPNINLIKVKMPSELQASLYVFPQSNLYAKGNMFMFGDLTSPRIRGEFGIRDLSIPELFLTISKITSKFEGKELTVGVNNVLANESDYNIMLNADLTPSKYFRITNLNLISNMTDVDKLMKVSDAAMKYFNNPSASSKQTTPQQAQEIPVIVQDGNIDIKQIKTGNIKLTDTTAKIALLDNIFYVNNILTSGFQGKIRGNVSMNLLSNELKAVLKGTGLDVEQTLSDAAGMKDTLSGKMDFDTNISLKNGTMEEQMKSLKGSVNFLMKNGTLGPFGKLENLILAENIRESEFFKSTIGSVLNSLLSFDTSHYNALSGHLEFNNGVADINPILSSGDIMATYIFGNFDLMKNKIDIKLRGRLGSQLSDSMGPLAMLNPVNLVKATPGMSLILGKIFFLFTEVVTDEEISQIPALGKDISDNNATKFQVVVRGDVAKPLTLVKSFKWLALESDMEKAKAFLSSIPQDTIPTDLNGIPINTEEVKTKVKQKAKDIISESMTEEEKENLKSKQAKFQKVKDIINKIKQNKSENNTFD